jgi:hypothetical protein
MGRGLFSTALHIITQPDRGFQVSLKCDKIIL